MLILSGLTVQPLVQIPDKSYCVDGKCASASTFIICCRLLVRLSSFSISHFLAFVSMAIRIKNSV